MPGPTPRTRSMPTVAPRRSKRRRAVSALDVLLGAVTFVAINIYALNALSGARLDLTDSQRFTLSQGTLDVIQAIEDPVHLTLYLSRTVATQVPVINRHRQQVQELLERYVRHGQGRIKLELIDPEPLSDAEQQAEREGLQAVPLGPETELYFGLVGTNTTDGREVIPLFSLERRPFLEYDLTRLLYKLTDPAKPVIGLLTGHRMHADASALMRLAGQAPEPWAIVGLIEDRFELKVLDPSALRIGGEIDVLLIIHPVALDTPALYAIDQFVLRRGRAIVFVDPHSEMAAAANEAGRGRAAPIGTRSSLDPLFKAWGFSLEPGRVVGDLANARKVRSGYDGGGKIVPYLPWLRLDAAHQNAGDVVTARLGPLVIASAGSLVPRPGASTQFTPLVSTSPESMTFDANDVRVAPEPERLIARFEPKGEPHVVAARVTGSVASAFPAGPPRLADNGGALGEHRADSARPINIVVVSDTDMLVDQLWQRREKTGGQSVAVPTAANGMLLINALEHLAGTDALIGLRSRSDFSRPFLLIEALRKQAQGKYLKREQALKAKLNETRTALAKLEASTPAAAGALLSPEQRAAVARARAEIRRMRKALQHVRHRLREDIERLETVLKFVNIGLVPITIALLAPAIAGLRRRRYAAGTGPSSRGAPLLGTARTGPVPVAAALLAIALATWAFTQREERVEATVLPPRLFPNLIDEVNEVARVRIQSPSATLSIVKTAQGWEVPERAGYPVKFETVKRAVVGTARLAPIARRTARPELHHKLHLEVPQEGGKGVVLTFDDKEDTTLASVVIGKTRASGSTFTPNSHYVRKVGENQTWLARGRVEVWDRVDSWLDRDLPAISQRRVQAVRTEKPGGEVIELTRASPDAERFESPNVLSISPQALMERRTSLTPGTQVLRDEVAQRLASALEFLSFEDVALVESTTGISGTRAEFTTFDGLVLTLQTVRVRGIDWVRFNARFEPGAVALERLSAAERAGLRTVEAAQAEARSINQRYHRWLYRLPEHKATVLHTPRRKLVVTVD